VTRTEERLTDALGAAARAIRDDTLLPLQFPERKRRHPAWVAPLAAAASLLVMVGLATAVSGLLAGSDRPGTAAAPPRHYVQVTGDDHLVVRSTATGAVTATVPVPHVTNAPWPDVVAATGTGTFFAAAFVPGRPGQRLYRFGVTDSGRVRGFSIVPGGVLGGAGWAASAMAATPDGSRVAVSFSFVGIGQPCGTVGHPPCPLPSHRDSLPGAHPDYIDVISPATGAASVWQGGLSRRGRHATIASLSWTADGQELAYLAQWCGYDVTGDGICSSFLDRGGYQDAEVWAVNPGSQGGRLDGGHLLLRQSARFPYIAQALISPDGSTITAVVLTDRVDGTFPRVLSVQRISVATGKRLGVLYRRFLGLGSLGPGYNPSFFALGQDGTGQHYLLYNGTYDPLSFGEAFNGRIDGGRLVPLKPSDGGLAGEAW